MKANEIKERIEKKQATIEKKTGTIEKKTKAIAKKRNELESIGYAGITRDEWFEKRDGMGRETAFRVSNLLWDIAHAEEDIKRLHEEIETGHNQIAKYEEQLKKAEKAEAVYNNMPECLKVFEAETATAWTNWDVAMRDSFREAEKKAEAECDGMDWNAKRDYMREWEYKNRNHPGRRLRWTSDRDIEADNKKDAHRLVMNLVDRCKKIAGDIVDATNLRVKAGNNGFAVVTGYVTGTEGCAEVFTILAGGYNIQRLHVRTLVKAR